MNHIGNILGKFPTTEQVPSPPSDESYIPDSSYAYPSEEYPYPEHKAVVPHKATTHEPKKQPVAIVPAQTLQYLHGMISSMKQQIQELESAVIKLQASAKPLSAYKKKIQPPQSQPIPQQTPSYPTPSPIQDERIIEGVFDGQKMIGSDGTEYPVPPNYASKSKLVEGDLMKLKITNEGKFMYKQIGPIERKFVRGTLLYDPSKHLWTANVHDHAYKLLTAAVTFHKGDVGSEVVLIVPKDGNSEWAAIEHMLR